MRDAWMSCERKNRACLVFWVIRCNELQKCWDTPRKNRHFLIQIAASHTFVSYNTHLPPSLHSKSLLHVLSMVLYCQELQLVVASDSFLINGTILLSSILECVAGYERGREGNERGKGIGERGEEATAIITRFVHFCELKKLDQRTFQFIICRISAWFVKWYLKLP